MESTPPWGNEMQSFEEHTAGWQRHWDRRRPYVALVVAEYESGERAALCTYCLDRRSEPHPRCQAPGCTCRWHARRDGEATPTPIEGAPKSMGLVWKTLKPWKHPRMLKPALVRVQLKSQEGRIRRRKAYQRYGFFWMKRPEKVAGAGMAPGGTLRIVPPSVEAAASPPLEQAPADAVPPRRRHISPLAMGAALVLLVVLMVPHDRTPLKPCKEVAGTATDVGYWAIQQMVLRAPTIINGAADPLQMKPPCDPKSVEQKGACWRMARFKVDSLEEAQDFCETFPPTVYVLSMEDCIKNHQMFVPSRLRPPRNTVDPQTEKKP